MSGHWIDSWAFWKKWNDKQVISCPKFYTHYGHNESGAYTVNRHPRKFPEWCPHKKKHNEHSKPLLEQQEIQQLLV
jgi:hypothetical protein